jgi:2-hydroxychromene-2-carboxylate isomerase
MMSASAIDFYFDFLSPYSYLASHRMREVADRSGCKIAYHVVDLARVKLAIGNNGPTNRSLPIKLAYLEMDQQRWAARYGIPLKVIQNYNTRKLNIGCFFAERNGCLVNYVQMAFDLTWGRGQAPDDEQMLHSLADRMGWKTSEFLRYIDSEAGERAYNESTERAITRHVFGVPTITVDDQVWWGNDRVFMIEEYLSLA